MEEIFFSIKFTQFVLSALRFKPINAENLHIIGTLSDLEHLLCILPFPDS